jgi:hypothetical protein
VALLALRIMDLMLLLMVSAPRSSDNTSVHLKLMRSRAHAAETVTCSGRTHNSNYSQASVADLACSIRMQMRIQCRDGKMCVRPLPCLQSAAAAVYDSHQHGDTKGQSISVLYK